MKPPRTGSAPFSKSRSALGWRTRFPATIICLRKGGSWKFSASIPVKAGSKAISSPDGHPLLSVTDHCLRSRNYINIIVAGKQPALQYLDMDGAIKHCTAGIGIWEWASNDKGSEPEVVMACAGDIPTLETLAAVHLL